MPVPHNAEVPRRLPLLRTILLVALGMLLSASATANAATGGTQPTKVVRYHGYAVVVPSAWPVIRLTHNSTACVRFDRHAVYLGQPPRSEACPAHVAGHTEALLVAPLVASATQAPSPAAPALPLPTSAAANGGRPAAAQLVSSARGVVVTATWDRDPAAIERALGYRTLRGLLAHSHQPHRRAAGIARAGTAGAARFHANAASATSPPSASTPGEVYTGPGFDVCSTPSSSQMASWGASPYRAVGVYIGGVNMACSQPNLTASWVGQESAAGWHLIPIYVGLQAPGNSCGCASLSAASASSEGTAAAQDAITQAQAIGLGPGNPIYYDMEAYGRSQSTSSAVLTFLSAWTTALHSAGYLSGVYSSDGSGIADLVANAGTGYAEPDDIWIANWNGQQTTADSNVPSGDWASHQRLHQYRGGHNESWGGATMNIDGDYLDASTAAAGSFQRQIGTAPQLTVKPAADGTVKVYPSWSGEPGIASWQILAGASSAPLTPAGAAVPASSQLPIVLHSAYPELAVQAIGSDGSVIGVSTVTPLPAHLAVFGRSAFVSGSGRGGIPVGCFGPAACHVTTQISAGRSRIATTGSEHVPAGGGLVFFKLTKATRTSLGRAPHHRMTVTVSLHDASGLTVSRTINLVAFATTGHTPHRTLAQSGPVRFVGGTEFVSHGWTGGILAGCFAATPCTVAPSIRSGREVIASAHPQTLGAGELGYVFFTLTAAGHTLLAHAAGNQLAVSAALPAAGGSSSGQIVLVGF